MSAPITCRGAGRGALGLILVLAMVAAVPPNSLVADAAMRGDLAAVRALLDQGTDVNASQGDGMSALHWAATRGDPEMTELLLASGAQVGVATRLGAYTPLHLASRAGNPQVAEALVRAGADPAARTSSGGATALHLAAEVGAVEVIEVLAAAGGDVDAQDAAWGRTPLMFAAAYDRVDALRALLALGADHAITTSVLNVPTLVAVDAGGRKARDATLAAFRAEHDAEAGSSWRPTPDQVQAAVRAAHDVQRAGVPDTTARVPAFANQVGTQGGLSPLLYAARQGHFGAVQALLDGGADIDQGKDGDGTTPLLIAVINGHFDLAASLLDWGANPALKGPAGVTPLYAAINLQWAPRSRFPQPRAHDQQRISYLELMEALLEQGADPNVRLTQQLWIVSFTYDQLGVDFTGATPFWRAAYGTDVEAMRLLERYGADPDLPTLTAAGGRASNPAAADPSGLPPVSAGDPAIWPLHAASGVGYGEGYAANAHRHVPDGWKAAVRYLVEEHGADVNARDLNGYTPLHHAAARGDDELIRYLVERGADVTAVSRRGQTTVDMANGPAQRISPFPATIALLEGMGAKNNNRCVSC